MPPIPVILLVITIVAWAIVRAADGSVIAVAVLVVTGALALGLVVVWWVAYLKRRPVRVAASAPRSSRAPDLPSGFGPKCSWIAVRSEDTAEVARVARLRRPRPAAWADGVDRVYEGRGAITFVTPPIDGWTFVMRGFPLEQNTTLLALSARFGEAQAFETYRNSSTGGWARAVGGRVVREVAFSDGMELEEDGARTSVENDIWRELLAEQANDAPDPFLEYPILGEGEVLRVAGAWSIDPSTLEERDGPRTSGLLGKS